MVVVSEEMREEMERKFRLKREFINLTYGNDENQNLDLIVPQKSEVHAIIYIHGGAYLSGTKAQYPSFLLDYAKDNIFATIDYRIISDENDIQMKDILSDIHDALTKITEYAGAHNAAIKDIILIGHSAGGHIALLYSYKYFQKNEKINIAACISLSGPADFTDDSGWSSMPTWGADITSRLSFLSYLGSRLTGQAIELTQFRWTKQEDYPSFEKSITIISPVAYVEKTGIVPPTLLVHSKDDDQVPYSNAERLIAALDNTSVPHKLITATGSANNHMLGGLVFSDVDPVNFGKQLWSEEVKKWIETYLE